MHLLRIKITYDANKIEKKKLILPRMHIHEARPYPRLVISGSFARLSGKPQNLSLSS